MEKDRVLSFEGKFTELSEEIDSIKEKSKSIDRTFDETSELLEEINAELRTIPGVLPLIENPLVNSEEVVQSLNSLLNDLTDPSYKGGFCLSALDIIVAISAGIVASVIDIVFVGTPEVVKIYRGGENFDGSILTSILRKVGNGDDNLSDMLGWLSDKCNVPYDIPIKEGVIIPNNHRLRNPGHDPLFGLLFAVADIILGTTTVIDNNGKVRILINDKSFPPQEKYLSVIFYLGHLLSDVCTARGLPIPGFFATQFFTDGKGNDSIASIAEQMYKDGYDLRHLASMSTPVVIKNMITDAYLMLRSKDDIKPFSTIAEKEILDNKKTAYKYRMRLVSDAVSCSGNVLKFFLPPTTGNITALNLPEWISLIADTIAEFKYQLRDKSVEQALFNREIISDNWSALLESL